MVCTFPDSPINRITDFTLFQSIRLDHNTGVYTCRYRHTFKSFPRMRENPMWCRRTVPSQPTKPFETPNATVVTEEVLQPPSIFDDADDAQADCDVSW